MKTAVFLYEPEHLALLDALIQKWSGEGETLTIVSLDAEIDYALEKRGITFLSGRMFQNRIEPMAYMRSDELTEAFYSIGTLPSLNYKGVPLMKPLRLTVHQYFQNLLYYLDVFERFVDKTPDVECMVVPASAVSVSKTSGPLALEEVRIVPEAARLVAGAHGIRFEMHDTLTPVLEAKNRWSGFSFAIKRALFGAALSFLNMLLVIRPRRPMRLVASDYWRNLAPVLRELAADTEVIVLDRSEALQAGIPNIWRHKLQFMHIGHFISLSARLRARAHAARCKKDWVAARGRAWEADELTFGGIDLRPTAERIMTHLVYAALPDVVLDVEGTYAMYKRLLPDAVWLRASVSGQRHFAVLPLVAREMRLPALEVQHGGEYLGPGSPTREHPAEYLAVYGKLVCKELRALGYANERLIDAGSPRFDAYIKNRSIAAKTRLAGITILSNTPTTSIGERYGTYSVEEYFHTLGEATRGMSDVRLVIASRSTSVRSVFLEEARERGLAGMPYESVGTTPLPELFARADIFVCSHSTVVYEALLYRLPVVIASFAPVEKTMTDFHFGPFEQAGAVAIAHTPEELREIVRKLVTDPEARARMSAAGESFMQKQFSFDGHAAERIANKIRAWVR